MNITFLGVGEACDPTCFNTSVLVVFSGQANNHYILLDCGFTTPHRYFAIQNDADALDAVWISHFHGDHFFGIPLLLLRFWEMNRTRPLVICGQKGTADKVLAALDLAYPGFATRLQYPLVFEELEPGRSLETAGAVWQCAENEHSQRCLSLRLDKGGKSLFYSGDGRPTGNSERLAQDCDFMIHESYRVEGQTPNHGSVTGCLELACKASVKYLALVHLAHFERAQYKNKVRELLENTEGLHCFLPEPGERWELDNNKGGSEWNRIA